MRCDRLHFLPVELVGLEDGLFVPVGPVDVIFEGGDREGMLQILAGVQHLSPLRTIIVGRRDGVQLAIHPVEAFLHQIQSDAIGPLDIVANDGSAMGSIHSRSFNARRGTPIRPVHPPINGIQGNGTWNVQRVLHQDLAHAALEVGQFDDALLGVCVIHMVVDPIHCQAIRGHRGFG